jgi:hypothetical protein
MDTEGRRKLGITPLSRAGATSQLEFSMNQAGLKKVTGIGRVRNIASEMVLSKQVFLGCLGADRRQVDHFGNIRGDQSIPCRNGKVARFREAGRRIEIED